MNGKIKTTENNMMTNFDFDAFYKWCEETKKRPSNIAKEFGYNSSYFSTGRGRGIIRASVYTMLLKAYSLPEGTFIKPVSGRYPWGTEEKKVETAPDLEEGVIKPIRSDLTEDEEKYLEEDQKASEEFIKSLSKDQQEYFFKFLEREKRAKRLNSGIRAERGKIYPFRAPKDTHDKLVLVVSSDIRSADNLISIMFVDEYDKYKCKYDNSVITFMYKGVKRCVNCDLITYTRREYILGAAIAKMPDTSMKLIDSKILEGLGM